MAPRKLFPDTLPDPKGFKDFRSGKPRELFPAKTKGADGVKSVKNVAGGTGPKAKSSSGGGKTRSAFESSFAQARKAGKATFTFNGKSYNTRYKGEGANVKAKSSSNKAAATPDPNPRVKGMTGAERTQNSKMGGEVNQLRAAQLKAFWGGMQPNMQGPGAPAPDMGPPGRARLAGPGPVRRDTGPSAVRVAGPGEQGPRAVAQDTTPRLPTSAAPPPMAAAVGKPQYGKVVGHVVREGAKALGNAVGTVVGGRPAQAETFRPGQQVPGARTGPPSAQETTSSIQGATPRAKRTPQQEDMDDGKTLAEFLKRKRKR